MIPLDSSQLSPKHSGCLANVGLQCAVFAAPARLEQISATRRWAAAALSSWGVRSGQRDDVVLIISELASNAALHGGCDMDVRLALADEVVQVTVSDSGRKSPLRTIDTDSDECGRGLRIVEYLARSVDVVIEEDARRVSVVLPA